MTTKARERASRNLTNLELKIALRESQHHDQCVSDGQGLLYQSGEPAALYVMGGQEQDLQPGCRRVPNDRVEPCDGAMSTGGETTLKVNFRNLISQHGCIEIASQGSEQRNSPRHRERSLAHIRGKISSERGPWASAATCLCDAATWCC